MPGSRYRPARRCRKSPGYTDRRGCPASPVLWADRRYAKIVKTAATSTTSTRNASCSRYGIWASLSCSGIQPHSVLTIARRNGCSRPRMPLKPRLVRPATEWFAPKYDHPNQAASGRQARHKVQDGLLEPAKPFSPAKQENADCPRADQGYTDVARHGSQPGGQRRQQQEPDASAAKIQDQEQTMQDA